MIRFPATNLSYRCGWLAFRVIFKLFFRARFLHPERVPLMGPAILAANHASFIDPPLVGCGLSREVSYLARESLFKKGIVGAILRSWQAVPVDRDGGGAKGLREILHRLERGSAILLFPEGTRTKDGQLQSARAGIGLIVLKSSVPVVPIRVSGTYEAFGRHRKFPKFTSIGVHYGRPMLFEEERALAKHCGKDELKALYVAVAARIMTAIGELEEA